VGKDNVVFLEVLEWLDPTGREVAHRIPEGGSGEFEVGAQVIVRDSHAAVFYSGGVACDALGPGTWRPWSGAGSWCARPGSCCSRSAPGGGEWVEETAGAPVPAAALERGRLI